MEEENIIFVLTNHSDAHIASNLNITELESSNRQNFALNAIWTIISNAVSFYDAS